MFQAIEHFWKKDENMQEKGVDHFGEIVSSFNYDQVCRLLSKTC